MTVKHKWLMTRYGKTAAAAWAGSALLLAVWMFGFYLPQHHKLMQLHQRYREIKQEASLAQKAASEQTHQELEQQVSKADAQLNAFTIPSDQVGSLVFGIGRMAGQLNLAGFSSKSVNVQATEKTDTKMLISEAWLSVAFQGSYEQFARFMNQLERNHPAVFVEKIGIQRNNKGVPACTFQMDLSILISAGQESGSAAVASAG